MKRIIIVSLLITLFTLSGCYKKDRYWIMHLESSLRIKNKLMK
jgi:hypothetical protein